MVENALARRSRFREILAPILEPTIGPFLIIFWQTFDNILENFGKPILEPNPPKTDQDEPKRAIRSCKEPKNCIYKKVVFVWNCQHFLTLKASQESLKKPKRLPREPQKAQETTQHVPNELQNTPKN